MGDLVNFRQKDEKSTKVEDDNVQKYWFIPNPGTLAGEPPLELEIHYSDTLVLFILLNYYYYYLFVIN